MKTTTFNFALAHDFETAVIGEFGCKASQLFGISDTLEKKVVVYLLSRLFDFSRRDIGVVYQICYLYVPKVVNEIENKIWSDENFKKKIINVCKNIGYDKEVLDSQRN